MGIFLISGIENLVLDSANLKHCPHTGQLRKNMQEDFYLLKYISELMDEEP
jgi:hypothetical protein